MNLAITQAEASKSEGGIPIGSVLVGPPRSDMNPEDETIVVYGSGHNQRLQKSSAILHAEMAALEDAGRLSPEVYKTATMVGYFRPS